MVLDYVETSQKEKLDLSPLFMKFIQGFNNRSQFALGIMITYQFFSISKEMWSVSQLLIE